MGSEVVGTDGSQPLRDQGSLDAIQRTNPDGVWDAREQFRSSGDQVMEETLEKQLEKWIEAACSESPERRRVGQMGKEFNKIYTARKWWCKWNSANRDYYEDGLYAMWWKYFWKYLCVGNPNKNVPSFYETRDHAVPRMLKRLKGELIDLSKKNIPIQTGDPDDYFAKIPAPSSAPDDIYNRILQYLEQDPDGELEAIVVGRQPLGKMRLYLKLRFAHPEWTVEQISKEMDIPVGTVRDPRRWQKTAKEWMQKLYEIALTT